ncbi:MAG: efflux RND transporter periplasmic adaptor subunit [Candidatus Peregrinibacteria bacterium]
MPLPAFLISFYGRFPERVRMSLQKISLGNYVTGLTLILLAGGTYLVYTQGTASTGTTSTTAYTVAKRTLVENVKAVGTVTFASEQDLRFNQKGTITKVNFQEGDNVKKGDIIAELDQSTIRADIRTAELAIAASALQLKQLNADKNQQIINAQNVAREAERQFVQANNNLAIAREKLPADLEAAKRTVEEERSALAQAKSDLTKTQTTELQSIGMTVQGILTDTEKLLDSFYSILTRDASARPVQGDFALEVDPLLFRDPNLRTTVEWAYVDSVRAANALRDRYGSSLAIEKDPAVLLAALTDAKTATTAIHALGESTYNLLQGASTGTTDFTASDLSSLRSEASANRATAASLISAVDTAQANLSALSSDGGIPSVLLQQKQDAVTNAENALTLAEDDLRVLQSQTPSDLEEQAALAAAAQEDTQAKKASLDSTTMSTQIQIQLKQNDIGQKSAALGKTKKTLEDYRLVAPFDGVIRRMDYKVGDNLLDTGEAKILTLENPEYLLITIPLDQTDVVRVKKGMDASIALDALPGEVFDGTIDDINATPVIQSGVVSYNVDVRLPTPKDLTILSGMTATVTVETAKRADVLAVPSLAISRAKGTATVQKTTGETVTVETGMTDGRYTEILSGIAEGDSILAVNLSAASSSTANANAAGQIFRLGGGGGGRPPDGH